MTRQLIIYWMWRVMSLVPGGVLLSSYLILNGRKREEARRVRKKVPSGRFMSDLNLVPASFFLTFAQPLLHLHPIPFLFNLKRREWGWRWAEKKWVGESLKKVSTTNRSWAWLPTITSSSLILLPSHSFWRKVRREEDDGHRLRELDEEVNGPPGRYLRLDLFIKVLSLLCPNLTDASSIIEAVLRLAHKCLVFFKEAREWDVASLRWRTRHRGPNLRDASSILMRLWG